MRHCPDRLVRILCPLGGDANGFASVVARAGTVLLRIVVGSEIERIGLLLEDRRDRIGGQTGADVLHVGAEILDPHVNVIARAAWKMSRLSLSWTGKGAGSTETSEIGLPFGRVLPRCVQDPSDVADAGAVQTQFSNRDASDGRQWHDLAVVATPTEMVLPIHRSRVKQANGLTRQVVHGPSLDVFVVVAPLARQREVGRIIASALRARQYMFDRMRLSREEFRTPTVLAESVRPSPNQVLSCLTDRHCYSGLMKSGTGTTRDSGCTEAKIQHVVEPVPFFIRPLLLR
jgi:hypothetical protein